MGHSRAMDMLPLLGQPWRGHGQCLCFSPARSAGENTKGGAGVAPPRTAPDRLIGSSRSRLASCRRGCLAAEQANQETGEGVPTCGMPDARQVRERRPQGFRARAGEEAAGDGVQRLDRVPGGVVAEQGKADRVGPRAIGLQRQGQIGAARTGIPRGQRVRTESRPPRKSCRLASSRANPTSVRRREPPARHPRAPRFGTPEPAAWRAEAPHPAVCDASPPSRGEDLGMNRPKRGPGRSQGSRPAPHTTRSSPTRRPPTWIG